MPRWREYGSWLEGFGSSTQILSGLLPPGSWVTAGLRLLLQGPGFRAPSLGTFLRRQDWRKNETASSVARGPGPSSSGFPACPSGLHGPDGGPGRMRSFGSLEVPGWDHTLPSSDGSISPTPFLRPPDPLILSLVTKIPSRNVFTGFVTRHHTQPSGGALGGRRPSAGRPDSH